MPLKESTHSTPRSEARGLPFDKLKAPSKAEGLRVDTERRVLPRFKNRGLAPSNVSRGNLQFFTEREREILNLIAEGYKRREIADDLNISVKTVEKYLYHLRRKTNLHSTSSLLDYAFEKRVIDIYEILESYFQKRALKQMRDNQELGKA